MSKTLIQEGLTVLKEVFNRPYPLEAQQGSFADYSTSSTDDGRKIDISIKPVEVDHVLLNAFDSFDPFVAKRLGWNPDHVVGRIDFSVDDKTAVTGRGDAPRIFATVVEAIRLSMNKNRDLVGFMFLGAWSSRSRLYRTMVRRLGRKYNLDVAYVKKTPGDGEFLLLGDTKRAPYMFTKEVFEDIGPKTSKQSIRPYTKRAARGLRR